MRTTPEIRSTVLWFIKALFLAQLVIVPKQYGDGQYYLPIWQPGTVTGALLLVQLVVTAGIGIGWLWLTGSSAKTDGKSS
jgi:hypothetical protein